MEEPKKLGLVCRKCGGPHLTIKCGPTQEKSIEKPVEKPTEPVVEKKYTEFIEKRKESSKESRDTREHRFKTTYRVKLSELPNDMTEEELNHMLYDWGHIVKIKLLHFEDNSVAYIDFGYEEEATYFIEAVDKTNLDYLIINAVRVES